MLRAFYKSQSIYTFPCVQEELADDSTNFIKIRRAERISAVG